MKEDKTLYRAVYKSLKVPVHMTPEWMDAVCIKGDWDVILAKDKAENITGVLVYHYREIFFFRFILMPPLCFYNGVFLVKQEGQSNNYQAVSNQLKTTKELIDALPGAAFFYQQFHHSFNNWMPFYWKNYSQSVRYTYLLDTKQDSEMLWANMKPALKRNIKNNEESLVVREATDFEEFRQVMNDCYKDRSNPYDSNLLERIHKNLEAQQNSKLYLCCDKKDKTILAGTMLTYDEGCSYYTCGFYHPDYKNQNAISVLMWELIKTNPRARFDFEGSMLKGVESYFRSFGAKPQSHYRIWKINSKLLSPLIKFKFKSLLS